MKPLEIQEIYEFAAEIAMAIKEMLDVAWYGKSGVALSICWSTLGEMNAFAAASPSLEAASRHEITITYKLVEAIYSEAFDFAIFCIGEGGSGFLGDIPYVPKGFGILEAAEFMFASGIQFLIFHELAHINQTHGVLRARYGQQGQVINVMSEIGPRGREGQFNGLDACIRHATEFAADFEALDWVMNGLQVNFKGDDFLDHAYLQCAIISSLMLMFNGDDPIKIDESPIGSHPYPLPRMDFWVKAYAERIRVLSSQLEVKMPAHDVATRLMDASFMALLKWMTRLQLPKTPAYSDFIRGAMAHPSFNPYMQNVINIWTEEYPNARNSRKFGGPLAVLYYSDEFRAKVGAVPNRESLESHVFYSASAVNPGQVLPPDSVERDDGESHE